MILELEVPPLSSVRVLPVFDAVELRVAFRNTHHVVVLEREQALKVANALTRGDLSEMLQAARDACAPQTWKCGRCGSSLDGFKRIDALVASVGKLRGVP